MSQLPLNPPGIFTKQLLEELVNNLRMFGKTDYRFEYSEGDMTSGGNSQLSFAIDVVRPESKRLFLKSFVLIGQENKEFQKEILRREFIQEVFRHAIFGYPVIEFKKLN